MSQNDSGKIGYWEATAIGIGGMVGGGIFAVLGLSVDLTRGGAPAAFLLAGIVAVATAYSYARLSVRFPSQGGTVAARPFLGETGFRLIPVAAMLSTASAINATLYGTARLSYIIAKDGELPAVLEMKIWNQPLEGLLITSGATLLVANLVDLSNISTMGSMGFLLIFAAVNAAHAKLADRTGGKRWISLAGVALCLAALASLLWQSASNAPWRLSIPVAMVGAAFLIEAAFRAFTRPTCKTSRGAPPKGGE